MNPDAYMNATPPTGDAQTTPSALQLPFAQKNLTADLAGDFSLPDYQPEIKRLLRIVTNVLPPDRYTSGDELTLSGIMDHFALYMGNDNRLYCAPLSSEYRFSLPLSEDMRRTLGDQVGFDNEAVCISNITADHVSGRVTAPRRLNIKTKLKATVKAYGDRYFPENPVGMPSNLTPERLMGNVMAARLYTGKSDPLPLQDDMILARPDGREVRVVCAEGQVMVQEASAGKDAVTCRGEVLLKLTLAPDGEAEGDAALPYTVIRKIPFSQAVELDGVTPEFTACGIGVCTDMSVEVEEGHLHTELAVVLEALAQKNEATRYIRDLYAIGKETACTEATYRPEVALHCFNGNFTLSDSLSFSEVGISPATRVIDVTATAIPEALTADPAKNRCLLTGRCQIHLLLYHDGEYTAEEVTLPFRYEKDGCPVGEHADAPSFDGGITVLSCRARLDGERIGFDAELGVALRVTGKETVTALSSVTVGEDVVRRRGEYAVCFPSPSDTLWSVAKRYRAPIAALSAANNLPYPPTPDSPDSLDGAKYLIV